MSNMNQVAELLNITLGQPFYIEGRAHSYTLFHTGLIKEVNGIQSECVGTLEQLLVGTLKVDMRFLPRKDAEYYIPTLLGVEMKHWQNSDEDRYYFDNYFVCRTYEDAVALLNSFIATSKEKNNADKKPKKRS